MWKFIGILLCALTATAAHSQYKLTPAETAQVQKLAAQVEVKCRKEMQAKLNKQGDKKSALPWNSENQPAYCGCLSNAVRTDMTPALLRGGRKEEFQKFLGAASQNCAAVEFKKSFPAICRSWFGDLSKKDEGQAKDIETRLNRFCECAQKPVEEMEHSRFAEVMGATTQDFADYKRSPDGFMSIRPGSLMPQWLACRQVNASPTAE